MVLVQNGNNGKGPPARPPIGPFSFPAHPPARSTTRMNPRQQRFVEEYLVDLNGYRAAVRAGYEEKWARHIASRLLRRPEIAQVVEKAKEERRERMRITADRVLAELARIAFADVT